MIVAELAACGVLLGALVWNSWRRPHPRRAACVVASICMVAMLAVLAWRPTRAAALRSHATIDAARDDAASFAAIEALAAELAPGATVELRGDGLDSASLTLLAGRSLRWSAPASPLGMTSLSWPRRGMVGQPLPITGTIDSPDTVLMRVEHPDGSIDTSRVWREFAFPLSPRAVGRWTWVIRTPALAETLGVDVTPPIGPRGLLIEARPNREGAGLARAFVAQQGGLLQRTRLTATDERVVRHGSAGGTARLAPATLATTDVVIVGPGALAILDGAERRALLAAVRDGLGLIHLVDAAMSPTELFPFTTTRSAGDAELVRVALPGAAPAQTAIPAGALAMHGGDVVLRSTAGSVLTIARTSGRGMVVATRLVSPSRWALAGEPGVEGAWWAALVNVALRPPSGEWRVDPGSLPRADHPIVVERVGEALDSLDVVDAAGASHRVAFPSTPGDTLRRRVVLWPREHGWHTLRVPGGDSLRLLVSRRGAFPSLAAAARRTATAAAITVPARPHPVPGESRREPVPLWWAWLLLIAAFSVLWRDR